MPIPDPSYNDCIINYPILFFFYSFLLECMCTILAGSLATMVGLIALILIYHPLHDWYGLHSEIPTFMWIGLCILITWISDRNSLRTGFKMGE